MATTTTVAMKDALITRLANRANLAGVSVSWFVPTYEPNRDWIMVDNIEDDRQEPAAIGQQRREESYTLHVLVQVRRPFSDDPKTVAQRAAALVAEIEDELRTDVTVNNTVRVAQITGVGLREWADGDERGAEMPVRIGVRARI